MKNTMKKLLIYTFVLLMTISPLQVQAAPTHKIQYLGKFKLTAYCGCRACSGQWGNKTAMGTRAKADYTVAVDRNVISLGTKLKINGGTYVAEDVGGAVKGKHIDIYFKTHKAALKFGLKKNQKVYKVVKL